MTTFKGKKTGFNKSGSNSCNPNPMGPPATKFTGRGSVPGGPLKRYPGPVADIGGSNRSVATAAYGDGGGDGVKFGGRSPFSRGRK